MTPRLTIGNRNYSSWSLRPWLCLKWAKVTFEERFFDLDQPGYGADGIAALVALSPNGKVPLLEVDGTKIWESVAIAEWAAEQPGADLLPSEPLLRAQVRAAVAEMHAGFPALRRDLPMNIRRRCVASDLPADTGRDLARLDALWSGMRRAHGRHGAYLFGPRSMADAFYLPVATRLRTYAISLSAEADAYGRTLLADRAFLEWERRVLAEPATVFSRAPLDAVFPGTDRG
ncbi:MAG: glutathione S-transferase [Alphaproteobacteria bacterium]|nr:glutathione S-transferase [Alphaproteobacteria bacterium]